VCTPSSWTNFSALPALFNGHRERGRKSEKDGEREKGREREKESEKDDREIQIEREREYFFNE
jgi:hypothetical protein